MLKLSLPLCDLLNGRPWKKFSLFLTVHKNLCETNYFKTKFFITLVLFT